MEKRRQMKEFGGMKLGHPGFPYEDFYSSQSDLLIYVASAKEVPRKEKGYCQSGSGTSGRTY
jgi:hypothetical protein